uniref:liprin-beta-1-like isoform X2 n=1 Tax=Myxine glutinosa TaxID=7769 RepID=UPI0035900177
MTKGEWMDARQEDGAAGEVSTLRAIGESGMTHMKGDKMDTMVAHDAQDTQVQMYGRAAEGNECRHDEKDAAELQVLRLAEELRAALEFLGNKDQLEELRGQVPESTAMVLLHWLQQRMEHTLLCSPDPMLKLKQLENDYESLTLQVSVLTDQVEVQCERLQDLASSSEEQEERLSNIQAMIRQKLLQHMVDLSRKVDELRDSKVKFENLLEGTKSELAELRESLSHKDRELDELRAVLGITRMKTYGLPPTAGNSCHSNTGHLLGCPHSGREDLQKLNCLVEQLFQAKEKQDEKIRQLELIVKAYQERHGTKALGYGAEADGQSLECAEDLRFRECNLQKGGEKKEIKDDMVVGIKCEAQSLTLDESTTCNNDSDHNCTVSTLLHQENDENILYTRVVEKEDEGKSKTIDNEQIDALERDNRKETSIIQRKEDPNSEDEEIINMVEKQDVSRVEEVLEDEQKKEQTVVGDEREINGDGKWRMLRIEKHQEMEGGTEQSNALSNDDSQKEDECREECEESTEATCMRLEEHESEIIDLSEIEKEDMHEQDTWVDVKPCEDCDAGDISTSSQKPSSTNRDPEGGHGQVQEINGETGNPHGTSSFTSPCSSSHPPELCFLEPCLVQHLPHLYPEVVQSETYKEAPGELKRQNIRKPQKRLSFRSSFFRKKKETKKPFPVGSDSKHQGENVSRGFRKDVNSGAQPSNDADKKLRGIKRLVGRLRKAPGLQPNSKHLLVSSWQPNSLQLTSGSRWSWAMEHPFTTGEALEGFAAWTTEQVCAWLHDLGLGMYVRLARQWIDSGQMMLQASPRELERGLGLKRPLHRKKLTLALQAIGSGEEGGWGQLDYTWVICWLDDVGLPQYKETFHEARVDGRMLHYMTVDDLLLLKVTSQLHHVSIKRAIQVLRWHSFRPDCLHPHSCMEAGDVTRWSNGQVMDWLHSVDLGEFASSLLGSGIHGGLLVLEPQFTIETLASLLSIPPSKSLLRRHLSTCLNMLVGSKAQALKQDVEDTPGATLLSISAKVKPRRSGLAKSWRREDMDCYVCPLDLGWPERNAEVCSSEGAEMPLERADVKEEEEELQEEQKLEDGSLGENAAYLHGPAQSSTCKSIQPDMEAEYSDTAKRQIGVLSEEIDQMTNLLQD